MRKAYRGPTLIALRARREALQVTREIAYPEIVVPPSPETEVPDAAAMRELLSHVAADEERERAAWARRAERDNRQWLAAVEVALVMIGVTMLSMIALHLLCG